LQKWQAHGPRLPVVNYREKYRAKTVILRAISVKKPG